MTGTETVQHLLDIEAQAQTIVKEAQKEADKRIAESSRTQRAAYQAEIQKRFDELDAEYQKALGDARAQGDKQLDEYRASLGSLNVNEERFAAFAAAYFQGA
jgi:vacuolar-type H+-ATPase subunit H